MAFYFLCFCFIKIKCLHVQLSECNAVGRERKSIGSLHQTNTIDSCLYASLRTAWKVKRHETTWRLWCGYRRQDSGFIAVTCPHTVCPCLWTCSHLSSLKLSPWMGYVEGYVDWWPHVQRVVCGWWPHAVNRDFAAHRTSATLLPSSCKPMSTALQQPGGMKGSCHPLLCKQYPLDSPLDSSSGYKVAFRLYPMQTSRCVHAISLCL